MPFVLSSLLVPEAISSPSGMPFPLQSANDGSHQSRNLRIRSARSEALATASNHTFLAGRLVLTCQTGEGPVALVFSPREPALEAEAGGEGVSGN